MVNLGKNYQQLKLYVSRVMKKGIEAAEIGTLSSDGTTVVDNGGLDPTISSNFLGEFGETDYSSKADAFGTYTTGADRPTYVTFRIYLWPTSTSEAEVSVNTSDFAGSASTQTINYYADIDGEGNNYLVSRILPPNTEYTLTNETDPNGSNGINEHYHIPL